MVLIRFLIFTTNCAIAGRNKEERTEKITALDEGDISLLKSYVWIDFIKIKLQLF